MTWSPRNRTGEDDNDDNSEAGDDGDDVSLDGDELQPQTHLTEGEILRLNKPTASLYLINFVD